MGYSCPVCADPQADGVHLANHLAFTAIVRGGDHESWLDEHVPEWGQLDDDGLAAQVTELAEETEYPQVFEDTTGESGHDHASRSRREETLDSGTAFTEPPAAETDDVLAEARELTRERRENGEDSSSETE